MLRRQVRKSETSKSQRKDAKDAKKRKENLEEPSAQDAENVWAIAITPDFSWATTSVPALPQFLALLFSFAISSFLFAAFASTLLLPGIGRLVLALGDILPISRSHKKR